MIIKNAGKKCEWCNEGPFEVPEEALTGITLTGLQNAAAERGGREGDLRQMHDAALALAQYVTGVERTIYHILAASFARKAGKLDLR